MVYLLKMVIFHSKMLVHQRVLYGTLAIKWDILTSFKNIRKGRKKHENKNAEHLGWAMSIAVYTKPRFFFQNPSPRAIVFFFPWALLR